MRKKILTIVLAGMLVVMHAVPVLATEVGTEDVASSEEPVVDEQLPEEPVPEDKGEPVSSGELVDVDVIDLSLHTETSGEFTSIYTYSNPFKGKDTSQGIILEFYAKPTWEVHELGAIFSFNGSGDYDGRLYFSPGSYLGFNSAPFGGFFDANLFNYTLVKDYIKDGAKMRIEILPTGFALYANDELCYDQSILSDPNAGAGDFTPTSDFSSVLTWIAGADVLNFGAGSWWNAVGSNEANINLSEVSFRLQSGTVVFDQLKVDKGLVESLGGSVGAVDETSGTSDIAIEEVQVDIFDINSVEYERTSVLPVMAVLVVVVAVGAGAVVFFATKKRTYDDV
ncbi:hypothetical protein [Anaerosporobacter sp.]|uniref:hypothetical protein n=1 Tax=Anaerosporobacter sp. TaxID=1872529 RepID=UPI00286F0981|nr:hypothetical protein [Anaerosporobacter sp.]